MTRKRRSNRCARPNRLDAYVVMFAFGEMSKPLADRRYRSVSLRDAQRMEAAGDAERFVEQTANGPVAFWRETRENAGGLETSPATLTLSTMDAVARRAMGDRLSGRQRDQVEKYDVWALVGDTKAACVRPRISDADRRRAEQLLGGQRGVRLDGTARCDRSRRPDTRVLRNEPQAMAVAA